MIQLEVQTVDELHKALGGFGEDVLYRGQIRQYGTADQPSMATSFDRNGCIPPLMLRWAHYARSILSALLARHESEISLSSHRRFSSTMAGERFTSTPHSVQRSPLG
jgi:hypothetical protein